MAITYNDVADRYETDTGAGVTAQQAAESNISPLLSAIRARGAARKKQAYQDTLSSAQERGIAFGGGGSNLGVPGVSGLAAQAIAPELANVQASTDDQVQTAIQGELNRLEDIRQKALDRKSAKEEQERNKKSGAISGILSGAGTGFAVAGPIGGIVGGALGAFAGGGG